MPATAIVPGLWGVSLGFVNAFILDADHGLAVIDTGSAGKILEAARELGREPSDLRHILVTHCHMDHAGGLAELKRQTGATVMMHPLDAEMVREGEAVRPLKPAPGLINAFVCRFLVP